MNNLTIGVTTYNEGDRISTLLTQLREAVNLGAHVIIYDDHSREETAQVLTEFQKLSPSNILVNLASFNFGGPAKGRDWIVRNTNTTFLTFVDGDDQLDIGVLERVMDNNVEEFDMIVSPYRIGDKIINLRSYEKDIYVDNNSILRLISGIGGRIYRAKLLLGNICLNHPSGRTEDARMNMNLMIARNLRILNLPNEVFYHIESGRRSQVAARIIVDELRDVRQLYQKLAEKYNLDDRYLARLATGCIKVIENDHTFPADKRDSTLASINRALPTRLLFIVFVVTEEEPTSIKRAISKLIENSKNREITYCLVELKDQKIYVQFNNSKVLDDEKVFEFCHLWDHSSTILVTPGLSINKYPKWFRLITKKLPKIHLGLTTFASKIETSQQLSHAATVNGYLASANIALNSIDEIVQTQFDILPPIRGFIPVKKREVSDISTGEIGAIGAFIENSKDLKNQTYSDISFLLSLRWVRNLTLAFNNEQELSRMKRELKKNLGKLNEIVLVNVDGDKQWKKFFRNIGLFLHFSTKLSWDPLAAEAISYGVPIISFEKDGFMTDLINKNIGAVVLCDGKHRKIDDKIRDFSIDIFHEMKKVSHDWHNHIIYEQFYPTIESEGYNAMIKYRTGERRTVLPEIQAVKYLNRRIARLESGKTVVNSEQKD